MATVVNNQNSIYQAQQATLTVTGVNPGDTLSAVINTKSVTYTCISGDTTTTAATGWLALLQASTAPPEFQQLTWSSVGPLITAVATTAGTPFTLSKAQTGSATCTLAQTVANLSPSDPGLSTNWLRSGSPGIPQNGDIVILQNSNIPWLWNLSALAAVQFASFTRYQSFQANIGLPAFNPAGYIEYLPTAFAFTASGTLPMLLGAGTVGSGPPSIESYSVGSTQIAATVLNGPTGLTILGTNTANTVLLEGATLSIATAAGQTSGLATATVNSGGTLYLGSGVTGTPTVTCTGGAAFIACASTIVAQNGSNVTVTSTGVTHAAVTVTNNSTVTWLSNSTITAFTLTVNSVFDKSQDQRPMTITNAASIDALTCQVLDPQSAITWTAGILTVAGVNSGWLQFGGAARISIAY